MTLKDALARADEAVLPDGMIFRRGESVFVETAIRDDWQPHRTKLENLNIMQAVASGRKNIRRKAWRSNIYIELIQIYNWKDFKWLNASMNQLNGDDILATDWEAWDDK